MSNQGHQKNGQWDFVDKRRDEQPEVIDFGNGPVVVPEPGPYDGPPGRMVIDMTEDDSTEWNNYPEDFDEYDDYYAEPERTYHTDYGDVHARGDEEKWLRLD